MISRQNCLLSILLIGCLTACSQPDNSSVHHITDEKSVTTVLPISEKIQYQARPAFEISEVIQQHDTLIIVSASSNVSYPLGHLSAINTFLAHYPGFTVTHKDEDPDSTGLVHVYTLKRGTNVVRLFKPIEDKWLEIASGKLVDYDLTLITGIHVGMTQQAFLQTFFTNLVPFQKYPIRIISLAYAVDGEIQHCSIKRGIVTEIHLASNFTIQ